MRLDVAIRKCRNIKGIFAQVSLSQFSLASYSFQTEPWFLKRHVFEFMTTHMQVDNFLLSQQLCQVAKTLWVSGNILPVDETIFEYLGSSPVSKYIPRKPRPNGLQAISMCTWTYVGGEPMSVLLDVEPQCSVQHNPTPHIAFIRLVDRAIAVFSPNCSFISSSYIGHA